MCGKNSGRDSAGLGAVVVTVIGIGLLATSGALAAWLAVVSFWLSVAALAAAGTLVVGGAVWLVLRRQVETGREARWQEIVGQVTWERWRRRLPPTRLELEAPPLADRLGALDLEDPAALEAARQRLTTGWAAPPATAPDATGARRTPRTTPRSE